MFSNERGDIHLIGELNTVIHIYVLSRDQVVEHQEHTER